MTTIAKNLQTANELRARFETLQSKADDALEALQHAEIENRPTKRLSDQHIVAQDRANAAHRELEDALKGVN